MNKLILIFVIAITVEGLVQYGKEVEKMIYEKQFRTAITQFCAIAISILLCLCINADIYSALGFVFNIPVIGILLTGIFASRGANYISDFVKKLQNITSK